jgi:PLP dependent protein
MSLAQRLTDLEARIAQACSIAQRPREHVRLIAVSKKHPPEAIREAYALGLRDFGENYAQELQEKAIALSDLSDLRFHFIGHLQSNKAKLIAEAAHSIQTVDSPYLAKELAKRTRATANANKKLEVLVEVNVGGEAQKHGCAPSEMEDVLSSIEAEDALVLRGLMTIPPVGDLAARKAFEALRTLQSLHGTRTRLPELSMGMSDDLEIAIACGATMIRVGTALFGPRS